jgi:CheY-like chemotaxis protein/HPt (histidine-containing phosphotransfer) domain-containing protein
MSPLARTWRSLHEIFSMRRLSLRLRVGVLVLVGVLPLLCFNLGNIYVNYRSDRAQADHETLNIARRVALAIEGELRMRVAVLQVLALSDALIKGDLDTFQIQADTVRAHQEAGTHILLVREDGQQLMNTAVPLGIRLPMRIDLENQRRVFASGLPSVSNVYIGQVLHRPIVAIDVPVHGADGNSYMVLSLTPMLDAFKSIISREQPSENWGVDIIDRAGRRIASVPSTQREPGEPEEPAFLQAWGAVPEGTVQLRGTGGHSTVWGFTRVPEFGWTIAVGLTTTELTGPALRSTFIACGVGLVLLIVGLSLAHLVSRGVVGPIYELSRFASNPDSEPIPVATGLRETDEVAAILMAQARQRHEIAGELMQRTAALKQINDELENEVTVRKVAEADQLAAKKAAEQANEAKSRFLAAITHELRTPLHGILGYAELLALEGGLNPTQSQRLKALMAASGPGVWPRHRDKLFQTFERLNAEAVNGIEGSGLGLALSAKLMQLMGGRIGYADNPEGGSIFWIELPCGDPLPAIVGDAEPTSLTCQRQLRVLVADDEAMNRSIASGFLAAAGHDVVCVDNGGAAVDAAATHDFDVILMDVRMPGTNGLQATRRIRALPAPRGEVRVIAVTAQAFAEQIETCRQAGMDDHLSKPFKRATLLAAIEKIVAVPMVSETASSVSLPANVGLPILDRAAFDDITRTLSTRGMAENLQTLISRCETLLHGLQGPGILSEASELAEIAHKLAGGAGTFGFLRVAAAARWFEAAADAGAPETEKLGDRLIAAINESVALARQEMSALATAMT